MDALTELTFEMFPYFESKHSVAWDPLVKCERTWQFQNRAFVCCRNFWRLGMRSQAIKGSFYNWIRKSALLALVAISVWHRVLASMNMGLWLQLSLRDNELFSFLPLHNGLRWLLLPGAVNKKAKFTRDTRCALDGTEEEKQKKKTRREWNHDSPNISWCCSI